MSMMMMFFISEMSQGNCRLEKCEKLSFNTLFRARLFHDSSSHRLIAFFLSSELNVRLKTVFTSSCGWFSKSSGHLKIKSPQLAISKTSLNYSRLITKSEWKAQHIWDGWGEEWKELVPHPHSDHGWCWTGACLREIIQSNTMRINFQ